MTNTEFGRNKSKSYEVTRIKEQHTNWSSCSNRNKNNNIERRYKKSKKKSIIWWKKRIFCASFHSSSKLFFSFFFPMLRNERKEEKRVNLELIQFFFIYIFHFNSKLFSEETSKYKSSTQKGQQKRFLYISYWTFEWTHCFSFQSSLIYPRCVCLGSVILLLHFFFSVSSLWLLTAFNKDMLQFQSQDYSFYPSFLQFIFFFAHLAI